MIRIDGEEYRNLVEQVLQNQSDIQYLLKEGGTLNEFGIKVVGQVATEAELPNPATYQGEFGDAFAVGTNSPYNFFIFTRAISGTTDPFWFNIGMFPGPSDVPGPVGPQGPQGEPGVRGSLWYTGTADPAVGAGYNEGDMYLKTTDGSVFTLNNTGNWIRVGSIRGPQGIQGQQGNPGGPGPRGPQGIPGPIGPQGAPFSISGTLPNANQLPTPTAETSNQAYLIGTAAPYDLYVSTGDSAAGYRWVNVGRVEGVEGPAGPAGEPGPQGEPGADGVSKPIYSVNSAPSDYQIPTTGVTPTTPAPAVGDLILSQDQGNLYRITDIASSYYNVTLISTLKGDPGISPTGITLTPASATQGTLTESQLSTLQANDFNYILLNNELYSLQDKSHESGYIVYTHVGMDTTKSTFIKTITITISTRGWVLTSTKVGYSQYTISIVIEDSLDYYFLFSLIGKPGITAKKYIGLEFLNLLKNEFNIGVRKQTAPFSGCGYMRTESFLVEYIEVDFSARELAFFSTQPGDNGTIKKFGIEFAAGYVTELN